MHALAASVLLLLIEDRIHGQESACRPSRPVPVDRWRGEYFNNPDLSGEPAMIRDDGSGDLRFNWELRSPAGECGIGPDRFSVRWTRKATFAGGVFRFRLRADDGVRLRIDGAVRIDDWKASPGTVRTADVTLEPGIHLISLEYYENFGSALVDLSWSRHPCFAQTPPDRWRAEFFEDFDKPPVAVRDEGTGPLHFTRLDENCLRDDRDYFVRWTRRTIFNSGKYIFALESDGPAKVTIDGKTTIDHRGGASQAEISVAAGNHTVVVEWLKKRGSGRTKLDWRWIN